MKKTSEKSENLKHENLENELIILPLDEADDLSSFNCKSEELNDFLKTNALIDQNNLVNRTRLCFYNGSLAGFYSLAADTIETKSVIDGIESYPYRKYPAIKIARLAIDSRFERHGIGTFLMKIILAQVISVCDNIGCRYLLVDSKLDSVKFYKKFEFNVAEKNKKTDFVPMYLNIQPYVWNKENTSKAM
jgi:GNAT superfamily N-acetyltransferase